jgi:hypothetical protein
MNAPAPTLAEHLKGWADQIEELVRSLVLHHGAPYEWNRNDGGGLVIITAHPCAWPDLTVDGWQLQSRLVQEYRDFTNLLRVLLVGQSEDTLRTFSEDIDRLSSLIERKHHAYRTTERALAKALESLHRHLDILAGIYSGTEHASIVIPDTNALYWNPELEAWRAPFEPEFTIVLTPAVVAELDRHKIDERASSRTAKAERLVRQIREYRRRGRLVDGVPLAGGISMIRAVAAEPRMGDSLPWLDSQNQDDRFLASALEIIRSNTRCRSVIVTRDINLQNKLELARLPFCEPADFVAEFRA